MSRGNHWLERKACEGEVIHSLRNRLIKEKLLLRSTSGVMRFLAKEDKLNQNRLESSICKLLADLACNKQIAKAVKLASGHNQLRLLHTEIICKPSGARGTKWHRDKDYLPVSGETFTCWVPLTKTRSDCSLVYADGSTRIKKKNIIINNNEELVEKIRKYGAPFYKLPTMNPGDINIHSGDIAHCSQDNSDDHTRISIAIVYVPEGSKFTLTPEQHSGMEGEELRKELMNTFFSHSKPGDMINSAHHPNI